MLCLMLCSADCSGTVLGVGRQHQHFPINAAASVTRPLAVRGDTRETEETGASENATKVCVAGFSTTDAQPAAGTPGREPRCPRAGHGRSGGCPGMGSHPHGCHQAPAAAPSGARVVCLVPLTRFTRVAHLGVTRKAFGTAPVLCPAPLSRPSRGDPLPYAPQNTAMNNPLSPPCPHLDLKYDNCICCDKKLNCIKLILIQIKPFISFHFLAPQIQLLLQLSHTR